MKTKFYLLFLLLFLPRVIFASHITSGDLTYTLVAGTTNQYKFSISLYRDCANSTTNFSNTINLFIYYTNGFATPTLGTQYGNKLTMTNVSGGTAGTTVTPFYYSPCLTFPSTLCVKKAVYSVTVTLPATPGGYTAFAQVCCRNVSNNFTIATNTDGATYMATVPGSPNNVDNSPQWTNLPPIAICQGQPFTFPCSATDADGDSLVYSLYTPFDGNNGGGGGGATAIGFNPLVWQGGYNLGNVVGGTPTLAINSATGILTCDPPTQGPFVVGIKVDQYRNGVYIGSIYRDVQFNINICTVTVTGNVPNTAGFSCILTCNTKSVTFSNTSTPINSLTTFSWNFGDNTTFSDTSHGQSPTYIYPDTGTYTVKYIMNPGQVGTCTDTIIRTVKVYNKPFVGFKYSTLYLCRTVSFTDTSKLYQTGATYKWSFGDGTTSTSKSPNHIYTTGGNKTVKLVVTSASGCRDSVSKILAIPLTFGPASIGAPALSCNSTTINFTSINPASYYFWDFGDLTTFADTSKITNPVYAFPDTGSYTISLFINKGLASTCWDTATTTIKVYKSFKVGFNYSPNVICINTPMQFTDTSTGSVLPNSWFWSFGDGTTSTLQNPNHVYPLAGSYQIKLRIKNYVGCMDSVTKTLVILPSLTAGITVPPLNCTSNSIAFQSTVNAGSYLWDFGDLTSTLDSNHIFNPIYTYPDSGVYQIQLIINPGIGGTCTDTANTTIRLYAPFNAKFTYSPAINCVLSNVQLTDLSSGIVMPNSWHWDFDDGTTSTQQSPLHYFNVIQNDTIELIIQNSKGCIDTAELVLPIYPNTTAVINAPALSCASSKVFFSTPTPGGAFFWDFGVSTLTTDTASGKNPFYSYPDSGTYTVCMILNPGAFGFCTDTVYFTIQVFAPFKALFKTSPTIVCPNYPVTFIDTSKGKVLPNSWKWDFGDGSPIASGQYPTHAYAASGNYAVKLVIQNSKGCLDSITKTVIIHAVVPPFNIIAPSISCNNTVQFQSSLNTGSYLWDFGEPASPSNSSNFFNPTHSYLNPGFFPSKLIVYPNTGCADTAFQTVNVQFGLAASFNVANTCVYDSVILNNTSIGGSGTLTECKYFWGDGDSSSTLNTPLRHHYKVAGNYTILLKVTNSWGCIDTVTNPVVINPIPIINAGNPVSICNLDTIQLIANGGGTYLWSPNQDINSVAVANPKVSPDKTTTYFVHVITPLGCFADDSVLITNINPPSKGIYFRQTICIYDSIQLLASGGANYQWTPTVGLTNPSIANPIAFPQLYTQYQVRVSTGNCVNYDTVQINVKPLAVPFVGPDITICSGNYATIHSGGGTFYNWLPKDHISFSNTANPVVYPIYTTTYTVTVVDTFSCLKPISDEVIVYVLDYKDANAGLDTSTIKNFPVQLNATGGIQYHWQPSLGLSDTSIANPLCQPPHDMTYILTVTSLEGCVDKDTIHVIVYDAATIFIPNAFSPNGDGMDDEFKPIYAGVANIEYFTIYNRWGNIVFKTNNLSQGWNGRFNNEDQEVGSYIWVIQATDITGAHWMKKGNLTLIR